MFVCAVSLLRVHSGTAAVAAKGQPVWKVERQSVGVRGTKNKGTSILKKEEV